MIQLHLKMAMNHSDNKRGVRVAGRVTESCLRTEECRKNNGQEASCLLNNSLEVFETTVYPSHRKRLLVSFQESNSLSKELRTSLGRQKFLLTLNHVLSLVDMCKPNI